MKTVIFDFDGTIADSFGATLNILEELTVENNLSNILRENINYYRSKSGRELMKELKVPFYKLPLIVSEVRQRMKVLVPDLKPIKGIKSEIQKLHDSNYSLGIITSNSIENVKIFLSNNDFNLFDFIYSDSNIFGKDKVINKCLRKHGLIKESVVYVGDEIRDIEASKKSGIKVIAVTWGFNSKEGLVKYSPDVLVEDPEILFEEIEKLKLEQAY